MTDKQKLTEGWQAEKHPSQRVYHYIKDGMALCRKLGFYSGDLMPFNGTVQDTDCKQCAKLFKKGESK